MIEKDLNDFFFETIVVLWDGHIRVAMPQQISTRCLHHNHVGPFVFDCKPPMNRTKKCKGKKCKNVKFSKKILKKK